MFFFLNRLRHFALNISGHIGTHFRARTIRWFIFGVPFPLWWIHQSKASQSELVRRSEKKKKTSPNLTLFGSVDSESQENPNIQLEDGSYQADRP